METKKRTSDTGPKKHILIVEDDKILADALKLKFSHQGFEVTSCYNGQQAIDLLQEHQYDVVLLDIIMPVKDGFSVLMERKQTKNHQTPITVLTAIGQEEKLEQAKLLGASKCLVKSLVPISQVVEEIKEQVGLDH